jgi:L-fuconate dehydratase
MRTTHNTTITITGVETHDVRFPTSRTLDGSDAVNVDPDYSAAYVILRTDNPRLAGHGLTFTNGRGNNVVCAAIEALGPRVKGKTLASITDDMAGFWYSVAGDTQLRWLGPEKGVIHLATGALINALWDLYAKAEGKPVWKLLVDLTPEQLVSAIPFRYITDAINRADALDILRRLEPTKAQREAEMRAQGYPAYTTSAGWLGYSDEKIQRLVRAGIANGWTHFKMKVGANLEDDLRRA